MNSIIGYESDERAVSSERFLSKDELRKIFGNGIYVTMTITKERRRYRLNHGKDNGGRVKVNYPVFRQKSKAVNLY
jgi:hypothetical protein